MQSAFNDNGERVYCVCRQPDNGSFMIQCDFCREWFHGNCVDISEKDASLIKNYTCKSCSPESPVSAKRVIDDDEPCSTKGTMAWLHDKIRSGVRKSFGETLRTIKSDLKDDSGVDLTSLAGDIEDELFDVLGEVENGKKSCGDKYKAKFRSLQFNLKDKKNIALRTRILDGSISPAVLISLDAKDLANDEIKAKSEAIRIASIANSIKPKDEQVLVKKTHKGEETIVTPVTSTTTSFSQPENVVSNVTPAPTGLAGILAAAQAKKIEKLNGPANFESLDDLLTKIDSNNSNFSSKRGSEDVHEDAVKKSRQGSIDQDFNSNTWADLPVTDSWAGFESIGDVDTWAKSPKEDSKEVENFPESFVWKGSVRMPMVGNFKGKCRQIAGRAVDKWENLMPPMITIEGRIGVEKTQEYIISQKSSSTKEVICVEFLEDKEQVGFMTLFNYFVEKKRYAVVGQNFVHVRDMYLLPILAHEEIPEFIVSLPKFAFEVSSNSNRLFGVLIVEKSFFAQKHVKKSVKTTAIPTPPLPTKLYAAPATKPPTASISPASSTLASLQALVAKHQLNQPPVATQLQSAAALSLLMQLGKGSGLYQNNGSGLYGNR